MDLATTSWPPSTAPATAFAWLSSYEGFGLPPLEAMAAGVPVVAYDTPVAREVYDTAATLVPVGDVAAVVRGAARPRQRSRAARRAHRDAGPAARHALRLDADGAGDARRAARGGAMTRADHRHRQLQRARRSGALPRQPARRAAGDRRTRSSSSTTPRPTAAPTTCAARPGVRLIALPANVGFAAANNAGIRATAGELDPAAEQRHRRAGRRRRRARRRPRAPPGRRPPPGRGWSMARAGPSCRSATWWRRWRNGGRSAWCAACERGEPARPRHGVAPHQPRAVPRLGQRRLPAGPARRRRGRRPARRALLHVPGGRRLLRRRARPAGSASCSCPRSRSPTCAAARASRAPAATTRALSATATAPSTPSTTRSGRRCCGLYLRLKGA